ncbi:MAG TPA: hypothetical protein VHF25_05575 [Nitriliruptorales bacterium]|nr:hypothetical protein [Nitriliruptorales bacterium]
MTDSLHRPSLQGEDAASPSGDQVLPALSDRGLTFVDAAGPQPPEEWDPYAHDDEDVLEGVELSETEEIG